MENIHNGTMNNLSPGFLFSLGKGAMNALR
jgi:hypothetical protein